MANVSLVRLAGINPKSQPHSEHLLFELILGYHFGLVTLTDLESRPPLGFTSKKLCF